jgi:tRNA-splicing ligase RtcB
MKKITDKLYSWASIIDEVTEKQAEMTSRMPFVYPHLALMPDAHLGKGATVGSVIPTLNAIIPAAVGVDIGCGMIAVKTQWNASDIKGDLNKLRQNIERGIPLSAGHYNLTFTESAIERISYLEKKSKKDYTQFAKNWKLQLGTLGSGNHFIEITVDENNCVWLFLHSGSRGIGNKIALYHIAKAQELSKKWFITLEDPDLAYLVEGTPEFTDYITDLNWAQEFALLNREEMMDRVIKDISHFMGEAVQEQESINCHHNFTVKQKVFGKEVWLSRKGAIDANKGVKGLIPGSMGTASYVIEGKGNHMSFSSSPHGAGRVYSRSQARKIFTFEELEAAMKGIAYRKTNAFIDEIPQAYKDIDVVMKDASDLVEIKHTLRQIVNIKGD